jgi:hypothetical protein
MLLTQTSDTFEEGEKIKIALNNKKMLYFDNNGMRI